MIFGKLVKYIQKNELTARISCIKVKSKLIKELYIRIETIVYIQEKKVEHSIILKLQTTSQANCSKGKIGNIKIRSFCTSKKIVTKIKH